MVQTYKEFKLSSSGKKTQTERGTVRISEHTASVNNLYSDSTKLQYELVPEKIEPKNKK